jgi:hypothetical protein
MCDVQRTPAALEPKHERRLGQHGCVAGRKSERGYLDLRLAGGRHAVVGAQDWSRMLEFELPSSGPLPFPDSLYLREAMVMGGDEGKGNGWVDRGKLEKEL